MKKAQSSIEVALLIGFMFLIFNIFLLVIAHRMADVQNQKDRQLIDDMGSVIESEIELAAGVEDGYSRTFEIPKTLKGINYSVELINSTFMQTNYSKLVLEYVDFTKTYETVKNLPKNVYGAVHHGENTIIKDNGNIYLNVYFVSESEPEDCTLGSTEPCPKDKGVCAGSSQTCTDEGTWPGCDDADYFEWNSSYENQEVTCNDNHDNDCDGDTDCSDAVNCPDGTPCNGDGYTCNEGICSPEEPENWLSGFGNRIEFTIDHNKIDSDLTWFPVTVTLSPTQYDCVFENLTSDDNRKKIAFTKSDGITELFGEIELWDDASESAVIHVSEENWVISSSEDTIFYMYYDETHSDNINYIGDIDSTPAQSVWDTNYVLVMHMVDATTSTIKDSTSYNNDGTKTVASEPTEITAGKVGNAQDFDGNDVLSISNANDETAFDGNSEFTVEGLISPDVNPPTWEDAIIICRRRWGINGQDGHFRSSAGGIELQVNFNIADTNWHHLAWNYKDESGTQTMIGYKDGNQIGSDTCVGKTFDYGISSLTAGYTTHGDSRWTNGQLDEIRISTTKRTAAWIKATYYSLWGDLFKQTLEDWPHKKLVTLTPATSKDDYQVKLKVDYDSNMNLDFSDLRFADDNGNNINYWVENYVPSTDATLWLKVPVSGTDQFYMYYGNPIATSESSGIDTFMFFDGFEDNDISDWDDPNNFLSVSNSDKMHGLYSLYWSVSSVSNKDSNKSISLSGDIIVEYWFKPTTMPTDDWKTYIYNSLFGYSNVNWRRETTGNVHFNGNDYDTGWDMPTGSWYKVINIINGSESSINKTYYDVQNLAGVSQASAILDTEVSTVTSNKIRIKQDGYGGGQTSRAYFDTFRIRKYVSPEPVATIIG